MLTVLALGLGGCQLARADLQEETQADRLIGMYITQEYLDLFDSDRYFNDHINQIMSGKELSAGEAESREYGERIYAVYRETDKAAGNYVFEGLEGISFFNARTQEGDAFELQADPEVTDIKVGVSDSGQEMEGTIYCPTDRQAVFYCNPVYQTEKGEVYLLAGTGVSGNLTDGASFQQRLNESRTANVNGEESSESCTFSINICGQDSYDSYVITEMNEQDQKINEAVYPAAEVPDSITVLPDTAYLICISYQTDGGGAGKASRQLIELSEEENELSLFVPGKRGLTVKKYILVKSPQQEQDAGKEDE